MTHLIRKYLLNFVITRDIVALTLLLNDVTPNLAL